MMSESERLEKKLLQGIEKLRSKTKQHTEHHNRTIDLTIPVKILIALLPAMLAFAGYKIFYEPSDIAADMAIKYDIERINRAANWTLVSVVKTSNILTAKTQNTTLFLQIISENNSKYFKTSKAFYILHDNTCYVYEPPQSRKELSNFYLSIAIPLLLGAGFKFALTNLDDLEVKIRR